MTLLESFFKWSLLGIVAIMVLSGVGSALLAGVMGLMDSAGFGVVLVIGFMFFGLLVVVPLALLGVWAYRWWRLSAIREDHSREFVAPDEHGRLPVPASLLRSPEFAHRALDVHTASYLNNLHTFNYSPQHSQTLNGADGQAMAAAIAAPGTFWQLYQDGQLPSKGFLMGFSLDEDGEAITADWKQLYSALIGGKSGMGKSTLLRSILAQSAMQGGRFVVIDPHYEAGEESLGASLQPLHALMLCDVATGERQIVDALSYVGAIGQHRLQGQDKERTPVVLIVDETTALLQRSDIAKQLTDTLAMISQETRKVGVYAMCIGQNFDGRIMDTTVRNSFVSQISMGTRRDVARVQSGNAAFGKAAEELTVGQCVWLTPLGEMHRLTVPNCTQQDLELVARHLGGQNTHDAENRLLQEVDASSSTSSGASSGASSDTLPSTYLERHFPKSRTGKRSATELASELATDERAKSAINMFLDGKSQSEIVAELWGATSGDKKIKAAQEFNNILRSHMMRLGGN